MLRHGKQNKNELAESSRLFFIFFAGVEDAADDVGSNRQGGLAADLHQSSHFHDIFAKTF